MLRFPRDLERIEALGATLLQAGEAEVVLLVSAEQLAALARMGFRPTKTDAVSGLLPEMRGREQQPAPYLMAVID